MFRLFKNVDVFEVEVINLTSTEDMSTIQPLCQKTNSLKITKGVFRDGQFLPELDDDALEQCSRMFSVPKNSISYSPSPENMLGELNSNGM